MTTTDISDKAELARESHKANNRAEQLQRKSDFLREMAGFFTHIGGVLRCVERCYVSDDNDVVRVVIMANPARKTFAQLIEGIESFDRDGIELDRVETVGTKYKLVFKPE